MKKRFNIYSMGRLILKDSTLERLQNTIERNQQTLKELKNLKSDEICFYRDKKSGRSWEFERVF